MTKRYIDSHIIIIIMFVLQTISPADVNSSTLVTIRTSVDNFSSALRLDHASDVQSAYGSIHVDGYTSPTVGIKLFVEGVPLNMFVRMNNGSTNNYVTGNVSSSL